MKEAIIVFGERLGRVPPPPARAHTTQRREEAAQRGAAQRFCLVISGVNKTNAPFTMQLNTPRSAGERIVTEEVMRAFSSYQRRNQLGTET